MQKLVKMLRIMVALATIMLLGFLAWQCIDIYLSGTASAAPDGLYAYEDVSSRLKSIAIPAALYALLVLITLLLSKHQSADRNHFHHFGRCRHKAACKDAALSDRMSGILRYGILLIGAALVIWGAVNGSLYDVLVKSINICTECIGLG